MSRPDPPAYVGPAYGYSDRAPAARERIATITAAVDAAFGNHIAGGVWLRKLIPTVGRGQRVVVDVAGDSADDLAEALAELERIRPTITPEPLPESLRRPHKARRRR